MNSCHSYFNHNSIVQNHSLRMLIVLHSNRKNRLFIGYVRAFCPMEHEAPPRAKRRCKNSEKERTNRTRGTAPSSDEHMSAFFDDTILPTCGCVRRHRICHDFSYAKSSAGTPTTATFLKILFTPLISFAIPASGRLDCAIHPTIIALDQPARSRGAARTS